MDLHLEGIMETLLVGAIAGMLVLSVVFFFMGHVLRIQVVKRFFQFLIYEEDEEQVAAAVSPKEPAEHGSASSHFVVVVLVALLYGAGVVVESWSHTDQDGHDAAMKLKAFDSVVHGRLASGADPEPGLAHFVADYDACHFTHTNTEAVGSRDLGKLEAQRAKGNDLSPCKQIDVRVTEFYHNAKNAVLQQDKYNEELINLQSRINFVRSIYEILLWLTRELAVVAIIATLAELFYWLEHKRRNRLARWLARKTPAAALPFFQHLKKLAAVRCWMMVAVLWAFTRASYRACDECNIQFDKRVYGYFLALGDGHGDKHGDHGEDKEAGARPGAGRPGEHDITPRSPYFIFRTAGDALGEHLEPSAVRKVGNGSRVIVANDADKDRRQMFWLFDVVGNKLVNPERICTRDDTDDTAAFTAVDSIEAMYVGEPDGEGNVEILGAPTFEVADKQNLVRFSIKATPTDAAEGTPRCWPLSKTATVEQVEDPCAVFRAEGAVGCRIEGMTSADIKSELLLGVHELLMPPQRGQTKAIVKPTVAIVSMHRQGTRWVQPQILFRTSDLDDGCRHQSGISDLSLRPNGLLYVLTSVDLHDTATCSDQESLPLAEVAQVRGALWRLDLTKPRELRLLYRFAHKPTGITDIGDGSLLVVFDDDGQRKSPIWAPRTFALEQNEAVFSMLPAAAEPRGSAAGPPSTALVSEALGAAK
ncbi:MAG TPA: hypothetical protein VHM31_22160 [Polyangia bacterium]|nr:hypothetical protein [Polyangia bacterium]